MELKPPVIVAIIVAVVVLLFGGFMLYDKRQKAAQADAPKLNRSQYMPPPRTQ